MVDWQEVFSAKTLEIFMFPGTPIKWENRIITSVYEELSPPRTFHPSGSNRFPQSTCLYMSVFLTGSRFLLGDFFPFRWFSDSGRIGRGELLETPENNFSAGGRPERKDSPENGPLSCSASLLPPQAHEKLSGTPNVMKTRFPNFEGALTRPHVYGGADEGSAPIFPWSPPPGIHSPPSLPNITKCTRFP